MKRKRIVFALLMLGSATGLYAQQEAQFTQYNDNMLYFNPAYAGNRDHMNITATHRQQWVGVKGAPMTDNLSIHTPLKYESVGVGLTVLNDKLGPMNQTWINANFAYSLKFKNKSRLAFGLNGGVNMVNARFSDLDLVDNGDPLLSQDVSNKLLPNFGLGLFYHSEHFYAGASIPRLIESNFKPGEINYKDQRHYYLSVGGYFDVNRMLQIRPSALLKITDNAPLALDGSLAFIFYKKLWLGVNYRLLESAGILAQVQLTPQLKLGYSLDISTSRLVKYNAGTHEIMLSYDLSFMKKKVTTSRTYYF